MHRIEIVQGAIYMVNGMYAQSDHRLQHILDAQRCIKLSGWGLKWRIQSSSTQWDLIRNVLMWEPLLEYHKRNWLTQFRIKAFGGRLLPSAFLPTQRIVKKLSQVIIQYAHFFYECSQHGAYIKLHKVGDAYVFSWHFKLHFKSKLERYLSYSL